MKKIILLSAAMLMLSSYEANAQVSIEANFGNAQTEYVAQPYRGYVMAPDYPSEHYDHHRHPHNDYWARRDQEMRERREHAEHGDEHHDNGNHDHR